MHNYHNRTHSSSPGHLHTISACFIWMGHHKLHNQQYGHCVCAARDLYRKHR